MKNNPKQAAKQFIKFHLCGELNYVDLKKAVNNIGYTVVEFNSIANNADVLTVIKNLKLEKLVLYSRGFTYADNNYRLIFVNEALNEKEKMLVIAHEIGHICLNHLCSNNIIGSDVLQENEANEFSHYLLKKGVSRKLQIIAQKHQRKLLPICILLMIFIFSISLSFIIKKNKNYYGNYYITPTGTKYHKRECIFVKNKTSEKRITKKQFETGEYDACDMCLPDVEYNKGE